MKLKFFLKELKKLPGDLELYIHDFKDNNISFKPLKGISWDRYEKKLSFGSVDMQKIIYEMQRKKGFLE